MNADDYFRHLHPAGGNAHHFCEKRVIGLRVTFLSTRFPEKSACLHVSNNIHVHISHPPVKSKLTV
jgi:hypothetical protein